MKVYNKPELMVYMNILSRGSYPTCKEHCLVYTFKNILAWEPSAALVTKSYFTRLPALERFYRETKFSL